MNTLKDKNFSTKYEAVSIKDMRSRDLKMIKKITNITPIKIPIRKNGMTSQGKKLCCHMNVEQLVRNYGGERITGYYISVADGEISLMVHAVWKTPEGKLVDVTQRTVAQKTVNPSQDEYICYFIPMTNDPEIAIPQILFKTTTNKSMIAPIKIEKIAKTFNPHHQDRLDFYKPQKAIKYSRKINLSNYYQVCMDEYDGFKEAV